MPQRIQRRRTKGWRMPEGAINVCRPCDWGNPYRLGDTVGITAPGIPVGLPALHQVPVTRALAVELFRAYVVHRGWVEQIRRELAGKDLVCWCPLDQPCHADVLIELANRP